MFKLLNNAFTKFNVSLKSFRIFILSLLTSFVHYSVSYAATPRIVTGTYDLLQAATGWLLIIIPVGAGLFVGFHALQKSMTEDQAVIAEKNKLIKNTIISAIVAECASGIITAILSFY